MTITAFGHTYTNEADALARLEWLQAEDARRGGSDDCRTEIILLTESLEAHRRATVVETPAPVKAPRVRPLLTWTITKSTTFTNRASGTETLRVEATGPDGRVYDLRRTRHSGRWIKTRGIPGHYVGKGLGHGGFEWHLSIDGDVDLDASFWNRDAAPADRRFATLPEAKAAAETIAKAGK